MNTDIIISITALVVSLTGVVWTIWYNLSKEKSEKINRVIDLQFRWNDPYMLEAREDGWYIFDKMQDIDESLTFRVLWDNPDDKIRNDFDKLHKIMSFWLTVYHLGNENKIDLQLAQKVFAYDYRWWNWRVRQLVRNTLDIQEDFDNVPDVFLPFMNQGISWLQPKDDS